MNKYYFYTFEYACLMIVFFHLSADLRTDSNAKVCLVVGSVYLALAVLSIANAVLVTVTTAQR